MRLRHTTAPSKAILTASIFDVMANNENLKRGAATQFRSGEEAVKNGQKGGVASGRRRRDRRTFRETLLELLALPDIDRNGNPVVSPLTGKPLSIRESIVMQALLSARKGNMRALQTILDAVGERTFKVEADVSLDTMSDAQLDEIVRQISSNIR